MFILPYYPQYTFANSSDNQRSLSAEQIFENRMELYHQLSLAHQLPWQWIAAIDQYERTLTRAKPKARPQLGQLTGIYIDEKKWSGVLNPDANDTGIASITYFNGLGKDGDGDHRADRNNDVDLLASLLSVIGLHGKYDQEVAIGLWDYYQNPRAVKRIQQFHKLYMNYDKLDLFTHAFPLPLSSSYAYRNTWGDRRGWGGRRIHEGTDLFASYGTPVRSTAYGIIEVKGWNRYGGWRVGIRDLNNNYHYYAHLSGFTKDLSIGQIVEPGQIIGWVGSSGYGKVGTSGKFPPHLHYGIYSDRGLIEWAFDPYPSLKQWERQERNRLRK